MSNKKTAPFGLRMQPEDKNWLLKRAEANGRSMNAELLQILKKIRELEQATDKPFKA